VDEDEDEVRMLRSLDDPLDEARDDPLAELVARKKTKNHPSEARIAEILVERHGGELRYVAQWGTWLRWDGKRWQEEKTLMVIDLIAAICKEISRGGDVNRNSEIRSLLKHSTMSGAEKIARADRRVVATAEQWDKDPWLLNTPGGVVNLRTGTMRQHRPDDYMTNITGVSPNTSCLTPTWDAHLVKIFMSDAEMIAFMHRTWGYCLTGDVSEDALFFCHGDGDNGKTTTIELLRAIWGDYAKEAPMEMFTTKAHGHDHPTELTILHGARLVTASENERGVRFSEARVKKITGGGRIKARKMRQDFYEFEPTHKLMFDGQHRPRLSSVGQAWKRRVNMIPHKAKILPEEKDRHIEQELMREAPGILNKIMAGCIEWQRTGLNPPRSVTEATDEYLSQQDTLKEWFLEFVEVSPSGQGAFIGHLYSSYRVFMENRGERPCGQTTFADDLESKASELKIKREAKPFWLGKDDSATGEKRIQGRGFRGIKSVMMPIKEFKSF
jgi:putative DNA primase/helicase